MPRRNYSITAIYLHWAIALLIAVAFIIGISVDAFPKSWDNAVVNFHVLLGLAILILSIVRLWWRATHTPPELPIQFSPVIKRTSRLGHYLLYIMMFVVPLVGIPTLLYRGRGIDLGLFKIPVLLARDPQVFRPLTDIHEIVAYALVALAVGHALAALYHQFALKDGLMSRIIAKRT